MLQFSFPNFTFCLRKQQPSKAEYSHFPVWGGGDYPVRFAALCYEKTISLFSATGKWWKIWAFSSTTSSWWWGQGKREGRKSCVSYSVFTRLKSVSPILWKQPTGGRNTLHYISKDRSLKKVAVCRRPVELWSDHNLQIIQGKSKRIHSYKW